VHEAVHHVQHVVADAEVVADAAGAVHVLDRAATRSFLEHVQGETDHLVTLLHQQGRSDGTVHPAAQADRHPLCKLFLFMHHGSPYYAF